MKLWIPILLICCSATAQNINVTNVAIAGGFTTGDTLISLTNGHIARIQVSAFIPSTNGFATNLTSTGTFSGNGSGLTNLAASGISGTNWVGTINGLSTNQLIYAKDTAVKIKTSDNVDRLVVDTSGGVHFPQGMDASQEVATNGSGSATVTITGSSGNVTATTFSGNGASLTALNASQLTSGTVPTGQLPVLGVAYPAALTNNDTRVINIASSPLTITPTAVFDQLSLGNSTGEGINGFNGQLIYKGDGHKWNDQNNSVSWGEVQQTATGHRGDLYWGGASYGSNYLDARYLVSSGPPMQTNIPVFFNSTEKFYPYPFLAVNSYQDMVLAPNGAWMTNMIAMLGTVAPGWKNTGWSNVWYDGGVLTNRVSTHLTNNGAAFPQGITGLVTYAHSQGFQIGAYVGHSYSFIATPGLGSTDDLISQDVYDIMAMGFDLLKVDNTGTGQTYQGLNYDAIDGTFRFRHCMIWPRINMMMSSRLGRKPLFIESTENAEFNNFSQFWDNPDTTMGNSFEVGTPVGAASKWQGTLTNFVSEMPNFIFIRPGHFPRFNGCTGLTAADGRGNMALHVLAPSIVFLGVSNIIGTAAVSPYYTNGFVNTTLLQNPFVQPGWMVSSNSSTGVSVISRPLGPYNNRTTTANQFTKPVHGVAASQAEQTQTTGYTTYGTDGTNLVGVFNLDTGGAHTAVISVTNIGCASNSWFEVFDVWNGGSLGFFQDIWTSPSIAASDSGLYIIAPVYAATKGAPINGIWSGNTGGQALAASTTAFYAPVGNSATNIATADVSAFTRVTATRSMVLGNLYVTRDAAGGVGHTTTVTIMTNGTASSIVASLNNSLTGNDTTHFVPIAAGVEIGIKIITPASDTPGKHSWSFEGQ